MRLATSAGFAGRLTRRGPSSAAVSVDCLPVATPLKTEHCEPKPDTIDRAEGTVPEKIERSVERPPPTGAPDRDARTMPLMLTGNELVVERDHFGVARK